MSGAGRKAETDYLFVECNESMRPYGVPKHRHLSEIEQELSEAAGEKVTIQFTPHLVPVNRGILSTLYLAPEKHFSNSTEMEELAKLKKGEVVDEGDFLNTAEENFTLYYQPLIPWLNELRKVVFPGGARRKEDKRSMYSLMKEVLKEARENSQVSMESQS